MVPKAHPQLPASITPGVLQHLGGSVAVLKVYADPFLIHEGLCIRERGFRMYKREFARIR